MNALRSGELARAAGVNPQTLRYYERRGLLAAPRRSPGGHRLYPPDAITRLQVIKAAQRLGFTLDEVAALLAGPRPAAHHGPRTEPGSRSRAGAAQGLVERTETKLAEVRARIAELTEVAETLRTALAAGCDDLLTCAHTPGCPLPFPAGAARSA